jgi:hypothetical protein
MVRPADGGIALDWCEANDVAEAKGRRENEETISSSATNRPMWYGCRMANEPEARTVVLPPELWHETDARAGASGTSSSAIIKKALLTYFDDLVGGAQAAEAEERASPNQSPIGLAPSRGCERMKAPSLKNSRAASLRPKTGDRGM